MRAIKWLYTLKNLATFSDIPLILADDPVFKSFFMDAKTANLMEQELMEYYAEKKIQWDKYAELETAKKEGTAAGISQGILRTAANMLADGADILLIQKYTGLSLDEIKSLR